MKKILSLVLAFMLTILLIPTNVEAAEAKTLKLNKSSMTIYVGAKTTLKNTGTAKNVKWSSTKPGIASVTQKGVITAKKAGKTVIVAKVGNNKVKCTVTVKKNLTAKQMIKKVNTKFANAKNFSINAYANSIDNKNLYMAMAANLKTNVVYMDMSLLGFPKMYVSGNKTYWQDLTTQKWYYFTSESDDNEFIDKEDLKEGLDVKTPCKLLSNRNFNNKRCATLRITQDGESMDLYFDLTNYDLIGITQGSGKEKTIMTIDTDTVVKIPDKIKKSAKYKKLSFE